jgi:hypothetical protein
MSAHADAGAPGAGHEAPGRGGFGALVRSRSRALAVGVAVVLAALAVAQGPAFVQAFHRRHWEDRRFFVHNQRSISTIGQCFTRPSAWPGLYRPLTTNCYYFLGRKLWSNRIEVYHAVNLAVFAANGMLLLWLCLDWMPAPWAWLASGLFVSRLAHRQLVSNSVEFQALASVFFALLGLKLFLAGRRSERRRLEILALPAFVLALLSKEAVVSWVAIVGLHGWLFDRPSAARRYLPPVLTALAWALLLSFVVRPRVTPEPTGFTYDLSAAVVERYVAYLLVFLNPLCLGTPPETDMAPAALGLASSPVARFVFGLTLLAEAAALWRARRRPTGADAWRLAAFGYGWFLAAAAPFVIFGDRLFMRYAYFPHAGLAIGVSALAWALAPRLRRPALADSPAIAGP